jgi:hypothetical protein
MSELQAELLKLPGKIKKTYKDLGTLPVNRCGFLQDLAYESVADRSWEHWS